jgi:hypothetical protein
MASEQPMWLLCPERHSARGTGDNMTDHYRYSPTLDEAKIIEQAGVEAAWLALQPLKDVRWVDARGVLACLRAFQAARSAAKSAAHELAVAHPEFRGISHDIDETRMVCSALYALDVSDPSALTASVGGARIATLFQAGKALEAMAAVYSAFDGDNEIFGSYLADETVQLAEAEVLRWERIACSNDEHRALHADPAAGLPSTGHIHLV